MKNYSLYSITVLIIITISIAGHAQPKTITSSRIICSFTVDSLGACQGVFVSGDTIFLYGDRECGVVRAYKQSGDSLRYLNCEVKLTQNGEDLINHPTGFAFYNPDTVFIGNSIRLDAAGKKWKAVIYCIDWKASLKTGTLDGHIINIIEDDACIQGTRPLTVRYHDKQYLATSDYGPVRNEVRLYNPQKLLTAKNTSESGIVQYRFPCIPWVQNLAWRQSSNELVLICNTSEGKGWQLNVLDLSGSIQTKKARYLKSFNYPLQTELEGFAFYKAVGIGVSSSRKNNVSFISFR